MNIKNSLSLICIIFLCACQHTIKIKIDTNTETQISGTLEGQSLLSPIFSRYLKDLDVLAGIDAPEEIPPTTITDILTHYARSQSHFNESTVYNKSLGSFTTEFKFRFQNIESLFEIKEILPILDHIIVKTDKTYTSLTLKFNEKKNLHSTENSLLHTILPTDPWRQNKKSRSEILDEIAQSLARSEEEIPQALKEITSTKISLLITTPRPIIAIQGGKILNASKTKAKITMPFEDILFIKKNKIFSISF